MCPPKAQKFVVYVKPRCHGNNTLGDATLNHIFIGFNTIWERNMWFSWLREVCFNVLIVKDKDVVPTFSFSCLVLFTVTVKIMQLI